MKVNLVTPEEDGISCRSWPHQLALFVAYDGGDETESDMMALELTPLTRIGNTNPRCELFLFSSRFFRHPKHISAHTAISIPMNTPIEMPIITPVDN